MVPTNLYFISPMGYLYIQMDEPLLQQALMFLTWLTSFSYFNVFVHFYPPETISLRIPLHFRHAWVCCNVFGFIRQFPPIKQPWSMLSSTLHFYKGQRPDSQFFFQKTTKLNVLLCSQLGLCTIHFLSLKKVTGDSTRSAKKH